MSTKELRRIISWLQAPSQNFAQEGATVRFSYMKYLKPDSLHVTSREVILKIDSIIFYLV